MKFIKMSLFIFCIASINTVHASSEFIKQAVAAEHRSEKNIARDVYRHPVETLSFFGIKPDMTVLEILPGGGWYTEILAPMLKDKGHLTLASFGADHPNNFLQGLHNKLVTKLQANPSVYGKADVVVFKKGDTYLSEVPDNSQDMVVTFRNTHNWIRFGGIEEVYPAFYRVLKKGGTLGIVQHRAKEGSDYKESAENGYVPEAYLISFIEGLGFELVETSEINANPKDTKDHKAGVWSLPPSYRLKEVNKAHYQAIGESDRMTLKFIKR